MRSNTHLYLIQSDSRATIVYSAVNRRATQGVVNQTFTAPFLCKVLRCDQATRFFAHTTTTNISQHNQKAILTFKCLSECFRDEN